ncbi:MAG: hypothetical protein ACTSRQ_13690 [Candidatus Thorarchaeota archaeon]
MKLAKAESVSEVRSILQTEGYWDDPSLWRDYGDIESNWSIVDNQQDRADGALVEKITNSVDALILRNCWRNGMNPESDSDVPKSLREAVKTFFKVSGSGTLEQAWDSEISKLSELISIVATGEKKTPCLHIIDKGIGQTPQNFPHTLMSLLKRNKNKIRFVQGQYNMGATGVIPFCGNDGVQLVISRRDPESSQKETEEALKRGESPDSTRHDWGFTITRVFPPEEGEKLDVLRYLAPNGKILHFQGDPIPLLPGKHPDAYGEPLEYGTFVKLYDYHSLGRLSNDICRMLVRRLNFLLFGLALPARLYERRNYNKPHYEAPLSGLSVVLDRNRSKSLETEPISETLTIDGNSIDFLIYIFKKETELPYATREGVAFLLNGQVQAWLPRSLFTKAKLAYIDKHLLVVADTSRLPTRVRSRMFMGSRDRLKNNELTKQLEDEIVQMLKDQEVVARINTERRKQQIAERKETNTAVAEQIKKLARTNPNLKLLLVPNLKLHIPFDQRASSSTNNFVGAEFPSFFNLVSDSFRFMSKNHTARVFYKTDVSNDYFSRFDPSRKGYFTLEIVNPSTELNIPFQKMGLSNSQATLRFRLPDSVQVGDKIVLRLRVFDQQGHDFIPEDLTIEIAPPQEKKKGGPSSRIKPPKDESGKDTKKPDELAPPQPIPVYEHQWEDKIWDEKWTEFCALRAKASGEHGYDIYLNMDNLFVKQELKRRKVIPDEIYLQWESAMTLVAMAVLSEDDRIGIKLNGNDENDNHENIQPELLLKHVSRVIAPLIIPLMNDI